MGRKIWNENTNENRAHENRMAQKSKPLRTANSNKETVQIDNQPIDTVKWTK